MDNAKWVGVRLRDVLDRAGVKPGAMAVRFNGLDKPVVTDAPDFIKSLAIDHARDGEVMLAYQMNGEQLPLLNGFPTRLIVPGWYFDLLGEDGRRHRGAGQARRHYSPELNPVERVWLFLREPYSATGCSTATTPSSTHSASPGTKSA